MTAVPEVLVVDSARFAHDTIDGETVVIDTSSGSLSMLTGFAATIWSLAAGSGIDRSTLAAAVEAHYGGDASTVVPSFVDDLVERQLLSVGAGAPDAAAPDRSRWPDVFAVPAIEQYDELSEIMTMDPIHHVDVAHGWPRAATDPNG